ncbi:hypothetical protein GCM10010359_27340 [Streptomyces morookaense]|nr:hypothetical protein GCM10010359_27340 [Streptomyces morookaense]
MGLGRFRDADAGENRRCRPGRRKGAWAGAVHLVAALGGMSGVLYEPQDQNAVAT